jgi:hypothetical protein
MNDETNEVQCSVFQQHDSRIKSLTQEVNSYEKLSDKGSVADELCEESETLLNCEDYNEKEEDCINCHTISTLRKRTAGLVSRAGIVLGHKER